MNEEISNVDDFSIIKIVSAIENEIEHRRAKSIVLFDQNKNVTHSLFFVNTFHFLSMSCGKKKLSKVARNSFVSVTVFVGSVLDHNHQSINKHDRNVPADSTAAVCCLLFFHFFIHAP